MIAFFWFSLRKLIWSSTLFFSGKRRSLLHPNTAQGPFFPLQSYSKKTLRKNVPKSARKYKQNVLMPPGHPIILFKCGRRTGKKVYSMDRGRFPRLLTVPYFSGISSRSSAYRYGHPCRIQISEGTVVGVCNGGGREASSQTFPAPKKTKSFNNNDRDQVL